MAGLKEKPVLTSADQRQAMETLDGLAAGHVAVDSPAPAALGMRWSDVPAAVDFACDDVEMAVVTTTQQPWGYEFTLRTIEDFPGQFIVTRTNDQRVYQATCIIGRFGDRTEMADALLEAFAKQMKAFGKKRSFNY